MPTLSPTARFISVEKLKPLEDDAMGATWLLVRAGATEIEVWLFELSLDEVLDAVKIDVVLTDAELVETEMEPADVRVIEGAAKPTPAAVLQYRE